SEFISVLLGGRAEFVKINLLIKTEVSVRPLALARVARIKQTGAIAIPGRAAAPSRELHARDRIRALLARSCLVDEERALLAAILREGNSHQFAVRGRHVPVDSGGA